MPEGMNVEFSHKLTEQEENKTEEKRRAAQRTRGSAR